MDDKYVSTMQKKGASCNRYFLKTVFFNFIKSSRSVKFFRTICFSVAPFILYTPAVAGTIDVPLIPSLFVSSAHKTFTDGAVSFDIDRHATILIKLPGLAEVGFDYEVDGFFRLEYVTVEQSKYKVYPSFVIGRTLKKGHGRLELNLRHTFLWSPETFPLLILQGTGRFTMKTLKAVTVSNPTAYRSEKNSAFFWRPEVFRSSLMNFITPIYWDFSRRISWPMVLGVVSLFSLLLMLALEYYFSVKLARFLPELSLIFILIFSVHFITKFIPMVHWKFFLTSNDKIRNYYPIPEFGHLAAASREIVKKTDKVVVFTEYGDWFSPKALCFNIAPVSCTYFVPGVNTYVSMPVRYRHEYKEPGRKPNVNYSDIEKFDVMVLYNSPYVELPPDFQKIYELNKNVLVAVKR